MQHLFFDKATTWGSLPITAPLSPLIDYMPIMTSVRAQGLDSCLNLCTQICIHCTPAATDIITPGFPAETRVSGWADGRSWGWQP